jgi:hypothetical protein
MPQIGAELEHLAIRVEAPPVPVHDRVHGEGVPQVMDARAAPVFAEGLPLAEADSLAHLSEVVSGTAVSETCPALKEKERCLAPAQDPLALGAVGVEPLSR